MTNLRVDVDKDMIVDVQKRLGDMYTKAPNVISKSLNRTITNVNSNIKKEVRERYHIKARDVSDNLNKPVRSSSSRLFAEVKSTGGPIPLDKFKVSPKTVNPNRKSPIKIAVKKDGVKKVMGAFVADINGKKVFKRTTDARLPIKRLFGPSVPQMLGDEDVQENVNTKALETLNKRLDHEISRILDKGRAKA